MLFRERVAALKNEKNRVKQAWKTALRLKCGHSNASTANTMTAHYNELIAQRADLDRQIKEARDADVARVIETIVALMQEHDLTPADIFPSLRTKGAPGGAEKRKSTYGTRVPVKYRDPATGKTWTGRGRAPVWIAGQNRQQFAVDLQSQI